MCITLQKRFFSKTGCTYSHVSVIIHFNRRLHRQKLNQKFVIEFLNNKGMEHSRTAKAVFTTKEVHILAPNLLCYVMIMNYNRQTNCDSALKLHLANNSTSRHLFSFHIYERSVNEKNWVFVHNFIQLEHLTSDVML